MSNEVSNSDTIQVVLTGLKNGATGRQTQLVNFNGSLRLFLDTFGDGAAAEEATVDPDALKKLAKTDPDEFRNAMAELSQKLLGGGSKPLVGRIVDAVCNYLEEEHDFLISDTDPGDNVYYVSRGDIRPTSIDVPGDGKFWMIAAAAPFGAM